MSTFDLLVVGFARWFLFECPGQHTNPIFWEIYEDAQSIYRAYCREQDRELMALGAMDIHMSGPVEYEP